MPHPSREATLPPKFSPVYLENAKLNLFRGQKTTKRIRSNAASNMQYQTFSGAVLSWYFFCAVGEVGVWMCGLLNGSERCRKGGIANLIPLQITRLLTKDYRKFARSHQRGFVEAQTAAQKEFASAMMAALSELLWPSPSKWSPHKGPEGPVKIGRPCLWKGVTPGVTPPNLRIPNSKVPQIFPQKKANYNGNISAPGGNWEKGKHFDWVGCSGMDCILQKMWNFWK